MSLWDFWGSHGFIPDPDIFGKLEKQWGELKLSLHFHIIEVSGVKAKTLENIELKSWNICWGSYSQSVSLQAGRLLGYFIKWKKS